MKFEEFQAGRWQSRYQYKSFESVLINQRYRFYVFETCLNLFIR